MNYYKDDRISQSQLKLILLHPQIFHRCDYDEISLPKTCFQIGNAVDCLLTEPDLFDVKFEIDNLEKPTGLYKEFVDELFLTEHLLHSDIAITEDEWFDNAYKKAYSKTKTDKPKYTLSDFKQKYEEDPSYFNFLKRSREATVLTPEQHQKSLDIVDSLKTNEWTKEIINCEGSLQEEIFWEYKGVKLKSKLDKVVFNKDFIYPFDIKTTERIRDFYKSFDKLMYGFQGAFYTMALQYKYPDKKIKPFTFIIESSLYPGKPLLYRMKQDTLDYWKEKVDEAIERYIFHSKLGRWDYTMEQIQNDGIIFI